MSEASAKQLARFAGLLTQITAAFDGTPEDVLTATEGRVADLLTAAGFLTVDEAGMLRPVDPPGAPSRRRVLIVEDNFDSREALKLLLGLYGHAVEEAAGGREAVEKALAWGPDVAVLDIGLPLLDGYEVARRLRAALGGRVLLIALTAYGGPQDILRAFQAGFDHHLTKPTDVGELLRLLRPA